MTSKSLSAVVLALMLAACATVPTGPSAMALPGTGRNFDEFRADDLTCRQYAHDQSGGTPGQYAADSGVKSAAIGTAVGALAGAAIDGGRGAAAGAGAGLVVGSLAGTGAAQSSSWDAQRRYDHGYLQCMYAKGHRIPVSGRFTQESRAPAYYPPPPPPR